MAEAAGTLNCLMCGAASRSGATQCEHCGARLATVACPVCFGMIFQGSRFCSHCGARADRVEAEASAFKCPNCEIPLAYLTLGKIEVAECSKCDGLWLDKTSLEDLCADREQQAAVLGTAVPVPAVGGPDKVRYIKCPMCQVLMHRSNFAGSSGVVVDVCRFHGTWFDKDELQRVIAFIRAGGMEQAREKQKRELEEARRRLEEERARTRNDFNRMGNDSPIVCAPDLLGSLLASLLGH